MFNLLKNKEPAETPVFAIIAGPGGESFNSVHIEKTVKILNQAGIETVLIGNGEAPISEDTITATLEDLKDSHGLTVCFIAHGYKTQKGGHILWLGEKADTDTFDLLLKIEKVRKNKSTDFVFTSSYGDTIVPKMKRLDIADIVEFNTLTALKKFDPNFRAVEQSPTMRFICQQLSCNEDELHDFVSVKEENRAIGCSFFLKNKKYLYLDTVKKLEPLHDSRN